MGTIPKPEELTTAGIHLPSASAKRDKKRMEEYRRIEENAKISWLLKCTFTRLGIGKTLIADWAWFSMKRHKKTFDSLKD